MEASGSLRDTVLQATKVQPDKLAALQNALGSVRRGGTLSIAGVYGGPFPMFPLGDLFDKQITVRMGQANVKRWIDDIVPLIAGDDDPLGVDDLITHRMPIDQAPYAYEIFQKKLDGCVKVVLEPDTAERGPPAWRRSAWRRSDPASTPPRRTRSGPVRPGRHLGSTKPGRPIPGHGLRCIAAGSARPGRRGRVGRRPGLDHRPRSGSRAGIDSGRRGARGPRIDKRRGRGGR